jgi:TonB family protein
MSSLSQRLQRRTIWWSLLFHALLLFIFSISILFPTTHKRPHDYVPAYVYKGQVIPSTLSAANNQPQSQQRRNEPTDAHGIKPKSILASSMQMIEQNQMKAVRASLKEDDPIMMIGDSTHFSDPLIKLIGHALSAHFDYPRTEGELGIKGQVLMGMTLHPDGTFSDVQIVASSNNENFDAAALYAVNNAPTIVGADRFLTQPKHFVIGFLFR